MLTASELRRIGERLRIAFDWIEEIAIRDFNPEEATQKEWAEMAESVHLYCCHTFQFVNHDIDTLENAKEDT